MERKQVLVVDAFADEPMGGRQVAVLPEGNDLTTAQRRAVADELGAAGTASWDDDELQFTATDPQEGPLAGAVAGYGALFARGELTAGEYELPTGDGTVAVEVGDDGRVWVEAGSQELTETTVNDGEVAAALNIDVAALRDVGADLPVCHADAAGGSLLVPVNFFEHLSAATPDREQMAAVLADAGATRLALFSFDTLAATSDAHARVFEPEVAGGERAVSAVATAGIGTQLGRYGVLDEERLEATVESGHVLDRPATVTTTLGEQPRLGGRAVTTVDGTISVPPAEDDDILEA